MITPPAMATMSKTMAMISSKGSPPTMGTPGYGHRSQTIEGR
jgi:hypothetical protein